MSELYAGTVEAYESSARSTAFFLEGADTSAQFQRIYFGFNEEVSELLGDAYHPTELSDVLCGCATPPPTVLAKLAEDKVSEVGDVLYYVTAAGFLHGTTLKEAVQSGFRLFTGQLSAQDVSFKDFDAAMQDRMAKPRAGSHLDYFSMQLYDVPPFDTPGFNPAQPSQSKGLLRLTADGRYVLERLTRYFSERILSPETQERQDFTAAAGLVLGGLSAVLQNRFGRTLQDAARNNVEKRARRYKAHTLEDGLDPERSRKPDQSRPVIAGYHNTQRNLVNHWQFRSG